MTNRNPEKLLRMPNYPKQRAIIEFLNERPDCTATLDEILENVRRVRTYNNSKKYLSQTMSLMLKKNRVIRVGRGKYKSNCCGK
jgi:hypothetical protein